MTEASRRTLTVILVILTAAVLLRGFAFIAMDRVLPLNGLYVDEKTFTRSMTVPGSGVFARPPGMYVVSLVTGALSHPLRARILVSILSLVPALAVGAAYGRRHPRWTAVCAGGLALSPMLVLSGMQLLPEAPAAALAALALLAAARGRNAAAGFLLGAASLFRAELLLAVPILLLLSLGHRSRLRAWVFLTVSCSAAVLPVVAVNLIAGGGPVIAANGWENLWLGTSWELTGTPPGVEFEQLMSVGGWDPGLQGEFASRAMEAVSGSPGGWMVMALHKGLAFLSLPGPGRNIETGWVLRETWLVLLLPLTLAALSIGSVRCFRRPGRMEGAERLAVAMLAAALLSAMVFFPAARYRTAVLPAAWFLAASFVPSRREMAAIVPAALILAGITLFHDYPGMERSGLTGLLAAEHLIETGSPDQALVALRSAEGRGCQGADLENLRGVALSMTGRVAEGLEHFTAAVAGAPASPTAWKNLSVSLWNMGMTVEAAEAARKAVSLNPLLLEQLGPILGR